MVTDASVLQLPKNRKIFGKSQLYEIKNSSSEFWRLARKRIGNHINPAVYRGLTAHSTEAAVPSLFMRCSRCAFSVDAELLVRACKLF